MRLLASGQDCDVYDHGPGLVLRRYRDGRDAGDEADLLRDLQQLGYPVPQVHAASGPDSVMTRIEGPTLITAVVSKFVGPDTAGELLAALHHRLHRLTESDGEVLLHLDLHPANVLVGEDGPVVVDWCNARRGVADLDVAMTALILAQVALGYGSDSPDPQAVTVRAEVRLLLSAFVSRVDRRYADRLDEAAALRLLDPNQSSAQRDLIAGSIDLAQDAVRSR